MHIACCMLQGYSFIDLHPAPSTQHLAPYMIPFDSERAMILLYTSLSGIPFSDAIRLQSSYSGLQETSFSL